MNYEDYNSKRKLGEYFGYPKCCIDQFMKCYTNRMPPNKICTESAYEGFVPCIEHSKQIKAKKIKIGDLIQKRCCKKEFPYDDDEFITKCRKRRFGDYL